MAKSRFLWTGCGKRGRGHLQDQKELLLAELAKPDANPDLVELIKKVLGDKK